MSDGSLYYIGVMNKLPELGKRCIVWVIDTKESNEVKLKPFDVIPKSIDEVENQMCCDKMFIITDEFPRCFAVAFGGFKEPYDAPYLY